MKEITSADQVVKLLGQKFGKSRGCFKIDTQVYLNSPGVITEQTILRKKRQTLVCLDKPGVITEQVILQERHTFSMEKGISKGSYMSDQQTLALQDEVRLGEESIRVTDEFNTKMGIAD